MTYLKWNSQTITDFSDSNINSLYNQGYVFTRVGRGVMDETRSLRIDLSKFELSSENRRVMRKTEDLKLKTNTIPYSEYHWSIGKLAKEFYDTKFGDGTFSANKVKELLTDGVKSNFNTLLTYTIVGAENFLPLRQGGETPPLPVGYCITYTNADILHYCYPFYQLLSTAYSLPPNLGLGMMLQAIVWAKENGKKYVYLGSFSRPTDTYKLQFAGLEWWDGENWSDDHTGLKNSL